MKEIKPETQKQEVFSFRLNKAKGQSAAGALATHRFIPSSGQEVSALVRGDKNGIFIYMLTSIGALLSRYVREEEVTMSIPSASGQKGDYITLTLDYQGGQSFRQHLNNTRDRINAAYGRGGSHIAWKNAESSKGSNVLVIHDDAGTLDNCPDSVDFILGIQSEQGSIALTISYKEAFFTHRQVEAFAAHLDKVMSYVSSLDTFFAHIDVYNDRHRQQILELGKASENPRPYPSLPALFEQMASDHPDKTALIYNECRHSYAELDAKANQLAHHLINQYGIRPGQAIGIMAERSDYLIIGILGALKAGAAYVPVDTNLPAERKNFITANAGLAMLMVDSSEMFNIMNNELPLFALDMQLEMLEESTDNPGVVINPEDPAYIIYTSGTSGTPKGVVVRHQGAVNMALSKIEFMKIDHTEVVLQFASLTFDASVSEIFMAFGAGGTLVMIDYELIQQTDKFVAYMEQEGVTNISLTPAYLYSLDIDKLGFLRMLLTAGEAINPDVAAKLRNRLMLINAYGPTECSVCVSMYHFSPGTDQITSIPIGKPIPNTRVLILDDNLQMSPEGAEGELYVSGISLAEGYLNNEELTDSRFLHDLVIEGTSWYKTGDLVRWEDGNLVFCGRNDRQIKIRGFRLEPEEVECAINSHDAIKNAHVFKQITDGEAEGLTAAMTINPESAPVISKALEAEKQSPELKAKRFELPNDLTIYHANESETRSIYHEIFEQRIYDKNGIYINDGDVIFDVGANIGLFSLYASLSYKDVKVYAFEPIQPTYELLARNMSLYPVAAKVFHAGISDSKRRETFLYYPGNTAISGMYADDLSEIKAVKQYMQNKLEEEQVDSEGGQLDELVGRKMVSEPIDCQLYTLSDMIDQEGVTRIDLLKIDVEKSEGDVLRGIRDEHWPIIRQIALEIHDIDGQLQWVENLLTDKGFEYTLYQNHDLKGTDIYNINAARGKSEKLSEAVRLSRHEGLGYTSISQIVSQVRSLCEVALPHYMVPSRFRIIDAFPLNNSGKVNEPVLAKLVAFKEKAAGQELPRNGKEQTLFDIWKQIFSHKAAGVFDDFFAIGGDSIKAIQIASKLYAQGYKVDINQIFEYPTIAALAERLTLEHDQIDQSPVVGEISLIPVQLELFGTNRIDPHHFNQSVLLHFDKGISDEEIRVVFGHLQTHHDILRTSLKNEGDRWLFYNHDTDYPVSYESYDLFDKDTDAEKLREIASGLQKSIDLENGPLMKLGHLQSHKGDYLLVIIHHMVVDTVSWRILLGDISLLLSQRRAGEPLSLPAKTNSFKEWASFLKEYAVSPAFAEEKEYWAKQASIKADRLPGNDITSNRINQAAWENISLDVNQTNLLLTETHAAFNTEITDLLLAALSRAVQLVFGLNQVGISLEGHGRQQVSENINVNRTVGWFTINYPVYISADKMADPVAHLIAVKENLRKVPNKGMGYGLYTWLLREASPVSVPQIAFNYLGQFDEDVNDLLFTVSNYDKGDNISPESQRSHDITINGMVAEGRLSLSVEYNKQQFTAEKMSELTGALKDELSTLIQVCAGAEQGVTPSDLTEEDLSMDDLDAISSLLN